MTIIKKISVRAGALNRIKIYKTISYRLISSVIGMAVLYYLTGSIKAGAAFSIAELVYKPIQYYLHERLWIRYERKAMKP